MCNKKFLIEYKLCGNFNYNKNLKFNNNLWINELFNLILFPEISNYKNIIFLLKSDYLKIKSEYINFKKRSSEDLSKTFKYAIENFLEDLLPVLDSLESALLDKTGNNEKTLEGIRLILNLLSNVFIKNGLVSILPKSGDNFDPYKHMAISTVSISDKPNAIFNILQKGYLLHERVIRPALVVVNKV